MDKHTNLTAHQIKHMDELHHDTKANEQTLQIALNFHNNMANNLNKKRYEWWKDIIETNDLDPTKTYKIDHINGSIAVVETDDN